MKKFFGLLAIIFLLTPLFAFAQTTGGFFQGSNLCEYLQNLYSFAIMAAGILTVGAMVFGGVIYVVSGGNEERVKLGKSIIGGAVGGMVLVLLSYVLFNTLSPNLLQCKMPETSFTPPSSGSGGSGGGGLTGGEAAGSRKAGEDAKKVPTDWNQHQPPLKDMTYSPVNCQGKTFTLNGSGCGPTSIAMILKGYGETVDPGTVATTLAKEPTNFTCGGGVEWGVFNNGISRNWPNYSVTQTSLDSSINAAQQGSMAIVRVGAVGNGHIMVMSSCDTEKCLIVDPSGVSSRHNQWFTHAQLKSYLDTSNSWIVKKKTA